MKIPHVLIPPQSLLFYNLFTVLFCTLDVPLNCSHKSRRRNRPRRRNRRKTRTKGDLIPSSQRTCVEPTFMLRKVADGGLARWER